MYTNLQINEYFNDKLRDFVESTISGENKCAYRNSDAIIFIIINVLKET